MIDPNSFDRVLAYGCSWTAGDELLDHEIIGVSFSECNRLKKKYETFIFNNKYNIPEPCDINRNASWAGQLAKLLNKPFENKAIGGSCMDHIYYNVYKDMINNNINDRDLVLVGLTSTNRLLKFIDKKPKSVLLGYLPHWENEATLRLFITTLCNDSYIVFSYFKTLAALNALKEHINIRIQPTSGGMSPNSEAFLYNIDDLKKYALDVWDKCDTMLLAEDFLKMEPENLEICQYQHQPIESHTALAKRIYNECVIK